MTEICYYSYEDVELEKHHLEETFLVGGITKISKVILKNFADDKELNKSVNPVEVVARQRILNREVTNDIAAMRKMNMKIYTLSVKGLRKRCLIRKR